MQYVLGSGAYGTTYLCQDRKSVSKMNTLDAESQADCLRLEVSILKSIPPHKNIVTLKDAYEDRKNVHLVLELCERGDLSGRIASKRYFEEAEAKETITTIGQVIQWLHIHGIMHRDVKPPNFMFGQNDVLKTIDFGLATYFNPGQRFRDLAGTPGYIAPEIYLHNYGPEVDVRSAGAVLYQILCGRLPFPWEGSCRKMKPRMLKSEIDFTRQPWPTVSDEAKSLIKGMLERNSNKRLTPCQILNHPWLRGVSGVSNTRVHGSRAEDGYSHRSVSGR